MKGLKTLLIQGELLTRSWISLRNNSIGLGEVNILKLKKFITSCKKVQTYMGEAIFWAQNRLDELIEEREYKRKR